MSSNDHSRLIATIGMMGATTPTAENDATGVNAYRQATRMLGEQGLTWRDVASRAFGTTSPGWGAPPTGRAPTQPEETRHAGTQDSRSADSRPRDKERCSGSNIPVTVVGLIRLLDNERKARDSRMMIIEVETDDAIYGPMVAHAGPLMDNVIKASGRRAMLRIRPTREGRQDPQVVGCSPM